MPDIGNWIGANWGSTGLGGDLPSIAGSDVCGDMTRTRNAEVNSSSILVDSTFGKQWSMHACNALLVVCLTQWHASAMDIGQTKLATSAQGSRPGRARRTALIAIHPRPPVSQKHPAIE